MVTLAWLSMRWLVNDLWMTTVWLLQDFQIISRWLWNDLLCLGSWVKIPTVWHSNDVPTEIVRGGYSVKWAKHLTGKIQTNFSKIMYFFNFLENFGWNLAEIFGDPPRRVSLRNPDDFRHMVDNYHWSEWCCRVKKGRFYRTRKLGKKGVKTRLGKIT